MKNKILLTLSVVTLIHSNVFAQGTELQTRLNKIYTLYKTDQAESCRQLEATLQSDDKSLEASERKKAYNFLANCHYQQKNLEKSVFYYKKASETDPTDYQPVFDMGTVYLQQGLYKEAGLKYNEALVKAVDDESKQKIKKMMDRIPELQKSFKLSTAIGYDSNVNSGPNDTTHLLYDTLNYTLSADQKAQDDFFNETAFSANLSKEFKPKTFFLFNAGVEQTSYFEEDDFNTTLFSTSMGYRKFFGSKSLTLSPFLNYQLLDSKSYSISSGINLTGGVKVSNKVNLWPTIGWYAKSFYNDDRRDAGGVLIGNSASYQFNPKTSWIGSLFYTYNNAENDQFTYNSLYLGNSVRRNLTTNLAAALGYNLQLFYYDDVDPAFGSSRRDDGHTFYLSFDYSLKDLIKTDSAYVSLDVSYNQNNSNHSFQENERLFSVLKFTYTF